MALKSFIDLPRDSHFPLENLPFGVFKPREGPARIGVALGEDLVDLSVLQHAGLFNDLPPETAAATTPAVSRAWFTVRFSFGYCSKMAWRSLASSLA